MKDAGTSAYELYAVLMRGEGKHFVYINPECKGSWFRFEDEDVSRCQKSDAIENNYEMTFDPFNEEKEKCPYMLIYVKKVDFSSVFKNIDPFAIPAHLKL